MAEDTKQKKAYYQPVIYSLGDVKTLTKGTASRGNDKDGNKAKHGVMPEGLDPLDSAGMPGNPFE